MSLIVGRENMRSPLSKIYYFRSSLPKYINSSSTAGDTLPPRFLLSTPPTIKTSNVTKSGNAVSISAGTQSVVCVTTNPKTPPIMEAIAIFPSLYLNWGSSPKIIGTDIGPTNAANQVIINPMTPPNFSWLSPTRMVTVVRIIVIVLAMYNDFLSLAAISWNFLCKTGNLSRCTTADKALISDTVIPIVLANIEASTSPTSPAGKNSFVKAGYNC